MKRFLSAVLAALSISVAANAGNTINQINVSVLLQKDGSAIIHETWQVHADSGTELYIAREDLREMEILDFSVREGERTFTNLGRWDINASRQDKAGKCGMVTTPYSVEMCWGFGQYGTHTFDLSYMITNVVESLTDYDYLHFQIVPQGLAPRKVQVEVTAPEPLSEDNSRIWGFGFNGEIIFSEGKVAANNSYALHEGNSVIILMRLEKGIFTPEVQRNHTFEGILERAMEGADFGERRENGIMDIIISILSVLFIFFMIAIPLVFSANGNTKRKRKKLFGMSDDNVPWFRDVPLCGNLIESDQISKDLGFNGKKGNIASAIILRFVYKNVLTAQYDSDSNVIFYFNKGEELTEDGFSLTEKKLYSLLYSASGDDHILQHKEFSKWAEKHKKQFYNWSNDIESNAKNLLKQHGYANLSIWGGQLSYTNSGKQEAMNLFGFKKFLEDYTLIKERSTPEVGLWQEYMVFSSLFGIADKVAAELKEINPALYEEMMPEGSATTITPYDTWYFSNMISRNIENARMSHQMAQARAARAAGGFGGVTSIGGGGGFHGGGHGGFR